MKPLTVIAEAIDRGDYKTALEHLKAFLRDKPEDPWGKFYLGRLQEAQHHLRKAEEIYAQVLKETPQVKLINLARQGIQRVQQQEKQEHQQAIVEAMAMEGQQDFCCLILEPMEMTQKAQVAAEFGRLMNLDPYTARLHLPSRIWRLYRTGFRGELTVYERSLKRIGIPAFCIALTTIEAVEILQVQSVTIIGKTLNFHCQNEEATITVVSLQRQEIQGWIEGLLPIFEQVVDQGPWRKVIHKEKIQDYAHLIDLHCCDRNFILRLCDRTYDFVPQKKLPLAPLTHHQRWKNVLTDLTQALPHLSKRSEFHLFAEAAFDQDLFLQRISPKINLLRMQDTPWDRAFHLYSILHWIANDR